MTIFVENCYQISFNVGGITTVTIESLIFKKNKYSYVMMKILYTIQKLYLMKIYTLKNLIKFQH